MPMAEDPRRYEDLVALHTEKTELLQDAFVRKMCPECLGTAWVLGMVLAGSKTVYIEASDVTPSFGQI